MNKHKHGHRPKPGIIAIIAIASLAVLAGCGGQGEELSGGGPADAPPAAPAPPTPQNGEGKAFSYSDGIDDNGYWIGIRALDYVDNFDYEGLVIPNDVHEVADVDVQNEIGSILESFSTTSNVIDRAVKDGDTVNIDYVGSVGGVEFDNGSTGGNGVEVTIGVTVYIDDFLEQLIGRMPGETFDVEVTFPEDYGADDLNGKDAVFVTTINYIVEASQPELDDEFVAKNFLDRFGWKTVEELTEGVHGEMQKMKVKNHIQTYLYTDVEVKSIPDSLIEYQENVMLDYYKDLAASYEMQLEDVLASMDLEDIDALLEQGRENNTQWARYCLVCQAIAEDMGLLISEEDVAGYFRDNYGISDYAADQEKFGLPYLKQMVMCQTAMDHIADTAVLE